MRICVTALSASFIALTAVPVPACAQSGARLTLSKELTISGDTEDLQAIDQIALKPDGKLAVLQRLDGAVRVYSAAGKRLYTLGRRGAGPGEMKNPVRLGWLADTLWVYDSDLRRVTMFDPAQKVLRTVTAPLAPPARASANPDLLISRVVAACRGGWVAEARQANEGLPTRIVALNADWSMKAVMARFRPAQEFVSVPVEGGSSGASIPFTNLSPVGALNCNLAAVAEATLEGRDANTFRVTSLGSRGDTIYSRRYPFQPERLSRSYVDSVVRARTSRLSSELARAVTANTHAPPVHPPLRSISLGTDGSAWVSLRSSADGPKPFMVLDRNGGARGTVMLPGYTSAIATDGTMAWVVEYDGDDVPSLVRYRLIGGTR